MDDTGQVYFGPEDEIPVEDRIRLEEAEKLELFKLREAAKLRFMAEEMESLRV